jgi:hypothetical protein
LTSEAPVFTADRLAYQSLPKPGAYEVQLARWEWCGHKDGERLIRWHFEVFNSAGTNGYEFTYTTGTAWRPHSKLDLLLSVCEYPRQESAVARLQPDWLIGSRLSLTAEYSRDPDTGRLGIALRSLHMPANHAPGRRPWE